MRPRVPLRLGCLILATLLTLGSSPIEAQAVPISTPLDSGTVARFTWADGNRRVGRLLAPLRPASDSVVYCRYPGPPCLGDQPRNLEARSTLQLRQVEVQRGSRAAHGALIGAGVGLAVLGLGRWAFSDADSPAPWTGVRVAGAVTFVALAAGIGALIGRGSTRWVSSP